MNAEHIENIDPMDQVTGGMDAEETVANAADLNDAPTPEVEAEAATETVESTIDDQTGDSYIQTAWKRLPKGAKERIKRGGVEAAITLGSYYGAGLHTFKMMDPRWKWAFQHVESLDTQAQLNLITLWSRFKSKVRGTIPLIRFFDTIGKVLPAEYRSIAMYPVEDLIYYMGIGVIDVPEEVASQAEGQALKVLNLTIKGGTAAGTVIGGTIGLFTGGPGGAAAGAREGMVVGKEVSKVAKEAEPFVKFTAKQMPRLRAAVKERIYANEHPVEAEEKHVLQDVKLATLPPVNGSAEREEAAQARAREAWGMNQNPEVTNRRDGMQDGPEGQVDVAA